MKNMVRLVALVASATLWVCQAHAQTADEVIEKHLTAMGGRAALAKLTSQVAMASIAVSVQGADLNGTVEIYNKAPNKMRAFTRLDLSPVGGGELTIDQRCDGKAAFVSHSMQGDRDVTGSQLQAMLNDTFPTPLLAYKDAGARVELTGKDTIGDRAVFVLVHTPKAGPATRQFIDAATFLLVRAVTTVNSPEAGGDLQQTTDLGDYRDVDGIKVPFRITMTNPMQVVTITVSRVENNKPIDDAMFAKPGIK